MNKTICASMLITLLLVAGHANTEPLFVESKRSDYEEVDSTLAKRPTLKQKFKDARKNNKRDLKRASKFYNPLTVIFRAFDI